MKYCKNCGHLANVTVNRDYDIPYTGGYSEDGTTIYIDKRVPNGYTDTQNIDVTAISYLVIHEVVEKALMDALGFNYNHAHAIAMGAEMHACTMDRVNYDEYYEFLGEYVKKNIEVNEIKEVPKDLDLTPYIEDGLTEVVNKIRELQST